MKPRALAEFPMGIMAPPRFPTPLTRNKGLNKALSRETNGLMSPF